MRIDADVIGGPGAELSVRQVKAARALLGWSQEDLAAASGVSVPTVRRLEAADGLLGGRIATTRKLKAALEAAGVEFTNGAQPGVRLKAPRDEGLRPDELNASNDD